MSYGGQSNAPWQRSVMQGHPQSGGFHQGSQMYMQSAQQNNMAAFGHGGMQGGGNMFPGNGTAGGGGNSVSYPQPRTGLNPVAFQQGGGGGGGQSHCNSIGTVTKINNDCGLVNDEIFFYRNVCKGPEPKLGDRVIFEATYSNNGQFKWNATRIQLMQPAQPLMSSNKNSYGSVAPPSEYQRSQIRRTSPKRSPVRVRHERDHRERERLHRSKDRDEDDHERKRRREDRSRDRAVGTGSRASAAVGTEARGGHAVRNEKERDRVEPKKKERELSVRERERERPREIERVAPKGRRPRTVKRYMVQIPRGVLTIKTGDIQELRQRYNSLYIPSDFFLSNVKWSDSFTPDNPFSLRRPCQFHIMHESVESPTGQDPDLLEPSDANYVYSAKVMLMSLPPITEVYKKCFENDDDDDHHAIHPSRLINFLVGVKGRIGSMAIGGPWSPSLDGENPDEDPSVLIRTAIRTCKALTGIDLSNCTQWYRFVELYYHRTEYKNMEKDGPPRVETVVIYLPDVHSCMPRIEEWQTLTQVYKNAADGVIARRAALVAAAAADTNDDNDQSNDVEMADSSKLSEDGAEEVGEAENSNEQSNDIEQNEENGDAEAQNEEEQEEKKEAEDTAICIDLSGDDDNDGGNVEAEKEQPAVAETTAADEENDEPAPEPTHYSLLDLKSMKVQEIRDELLARNLSDKGVRNVVMARLAKAMNNEKAEEHKNKKNKPHTTPQKPVAVKKANESNNKDKKDSVKMEVDNETPSKKTDEAKKKSDKKTGTAGDNSNGKNVKSAKSPNAKKPKVKNEKDEKEDWADIIDFELSDIVILDEYDSNKNNEENNLKEMTEREKNQLIRFHTLPSTPHIIVHPNRQAKGGKFDCAVVSLSVLLDYHPDDSKERFFEVSLFAELFNEMLMRDFGFNIYKEMYLYKENPETNVISEAEGDTKTEADNKAGDEVKKESKDKEKEEEKDKSSKKDSKPPHEDKSGKDHHNEEIQSVKSESRKRKISTSTSLANGKDREVSVSKKKMVVVKPELLLSFIYFDASYCGYIFDKHLEDLFYVLGLNLSRSQIKSVLAKLGKSTVSPQPIYYRKLTEREASLESTPAIEDVNDLPIEEQQRIAAGNNYYEEVFGRNTARNQICAIENDGNEGLINFNGAVVDVGKLLNQINRTEKSYSDLEKVHNDLLKQHGDLQKDHNKSTGKVKDLQSEIKSVSRKLTDANQDFYSLNRKYRDQNATLSYIYTRVAPYFAREKDKEKDAKLEGTRDKDEKKEKDKSNDKECEKGKDGKGKEIKSEVNKNKENAKDGVEKEEATDDKEIIDVKDEKETDKNKVKDEMVKDEKEKAKDEKEKAKDEKEKVKDEKEKVKDDKDKEKEKEKVKDEKEKVKDNKEKEKPKDDKQKQIVKEDKIKPPITPKIITEKQKPLTPALKKIADSRTPGKFVRKNEGIAKK